MVCGFYGGGGGLAKQACLLLVVVFRGVAGRRVAGGALSGGGAVVLLVWCCWPRGCWWRAKCFGFDDLIIAKLIFGLSPLCSRTCSTVLFHEGV